MMLLCVESNMYLRMAVLCVAMMVPGDLLVQTLGVSKDLDPVKSKHGSGYS